MTVATRHPRMAPISARRIAGGALVAGCLTVAVVGCRSVTADECASSAQRVGWKLIVVSAACDTSTVWITPPPDIPVFGGDS